MHKQLLPFQAPLPAYEEQAQELFAELQAQGDEAAWRFKWLHPSFRNKSIADVRAATLELSDAQLVIACEHSFADWAALEAFTIAVAQPGPICRFEQAVEAVISGNVQELQTLLTTNPELVHERSPRRHRATLLHYIAANGVENYRQRTPANAVEVTKTLLNAGADVNAVASCYELKATTLCLLVSSCHPANAGLQTVLAETLLDYGATMAESEGYYSSTLLTTLAFGYLDTARALARRGTPLDDLAAVAGLGRFDDVARLLPTADHVSRHRAMALAAQHGHARVLQLLLEAGVDPNSFNPEGYHAHSTPLHQAALAGHSDGVRLLVEHGARLDIRDTIYQATPLGWAMHGDQTACTDYLRSQGAK